uniref:LF2 protein n=1 Tax=Epstein-Barr virus (strain GD1) TaxID=10376 RepID=A0A0X8WER3_EBVG|nr:LF2 protein [human gammaherpesvirus 4]
MAEAYPGGAHAALASRRSSFRNSLRRLRPTEKPDTSFMRGVWKYEIFPSYVRVTNKQVLQLDAQCQELPPCPSVGQILSFKLPSFSFNTTTYGSRYFTVAFLFFGAEDNEVFLKPFFVMHSDQDIVLSVLNPRSLFIEKGKFTWYIVPIRLVKNPYLYLQILPGQSDIQLTRSCTQSGDKLNTSEPQIFLSGSPVTSQDECLPYLLAQHTPPFLKSYARIHTFPGKVCPVNAIRRGKGYIRVSVDTPDLKREGPLNVKVGMTLLDDVIIAFRYNPYPKSHWRWDGESTDIRYFGSPVIIPPNFITELEYNNTYEAPLSSKITAVVVSHSSNPVFYVYPQEWKPGQTLKLTVRNISNNPITIVTGQSMAQAFFIYAGDPSISTIMRRYIQRQGCALTLPGNIVVESSSLPTFERINKTFNGNIVASEGTL